MVNENVEVGPFHDIGIMNCKEKRIYGKMRGSSEPVNEKQVNR